MTSCEYRNELDETHARFVQSAPMIYLKVRNWKCG